MSNTYPIPLTNGIHDIDIPSPVGGLQYITFKCATYPSAGTMTVKVLSEGSDTFVNARNTEVSLTGESTVEVFGSITKYRLTISGVVGGARLTANVVNEAARGFPDGVFTGLRATTVQGYIEANVKNGTQFEFSALVPSLAPAATVGTIMVTGAKPVIIKDRQLRFDGEQITAQVFRTPTYTGGVAQPIYNLTDISPQATTVSIVSGATITANGTEVGAPTYAIGSTSPGASTSASYATNGSERVLRPNTAYLLLVTNSGTDTTKISAYITWFEGTPDFPLP